VSKPHVLVIAADPAEIRQVHQVLGSTCRVGFATTPQRGYELCREQLPDLLIIDVALPEVDGVTLARRLRREALTAHIPFLLMVDRAHPHDIALGFQAGASDYVHTPLEPALLKARVQTHLRIKQASERMARQAGIDALTHLADRNVFDRTLDRAWKRAWRTETPIGLVLLELDHFEPYVQLYGRPAGDQTLRETAMALDRVALRPDDLLARWGQWTFALLLPDTPLHGTRCLGLACAAAVRALSLPHAGSSVSPIVTASVGLASRIPDRADAQELMRDATRSLAGAIERGRDAVKGGTPAMAPARRADDTSVA
jgi:diguanylate cyclase (GGDEF)-like protein